MPPKDPFALVERHVAVLREGSQRTGDERDVLGEVFDRDTLLAIYKLMTDGYIETVEYPVSTGKEGNVFMALSPEGKMTALKIYRTATSTFKRISKYIEGDPRFRGISGSRRKVIYAWAAKEYRNLQRFTDAGVRVPVPIRFYKNLLLMEYIGTKTAPAPLLRNVVLENPEKVYALLIKYMKKGYQKAQLVHGDLSEFNILIYRKNPVIIDCGQAFVTDHPNAKEFLEKDIENINRYFRTLGIEVGDSKELFAEITGESK